MITAKDLNDCPEVVCRYLTKAGVVGKAKKSLALISHNGEFRLKPNQRWYPIHGEYIFTPKVPAFIWKAKIKIFPLISILAKDSYHSGVGRNVVKLNSFYPLANESGKELSESALGRLLIELILIPTELVPNDKLKWKAIDSNHARVTFHNSDFQVSALFEFGPDDLPVKTTIDRFGKFDGKLVRKPFICDISDYKVFENLLIPTNIKGCWDLGSELFYWFHFKIKSVHYE